MDYSKTLNLPQTNFPMRANLPIRELEILKLWEEIDIYNKVQEKQKERPKYILHDGPPYSNGDIHIGHALNKILKDIVVKYKTISGFNSPYIPGWDTHGLPTEIQALKLLNLDKEKITPQDLREKCKKTAEHYLNIQRKQFIRLGVRGNWENPYITFLPHYEAKEISAFLELIKQDAVYRSLKPVYWCWRCETSLADAEIEYKEHTSPSIYVKFKVMDNTSFSFSLPTYIIIWTTTPWTLPANVAVAVHPKYLYAAVKVGEEIFIMAEELLSSTLSTLNIKNYEIIKTFPGVELGGIKIKHPFMEREGVIILADYISKETGCGCVHIAPGHGLEDYLTGLRYNLPIISPVDNKGRFTSDIDFVCGELVFSANEKIIDKMKEKGNLLSCSEIVHSYPHCWRCSQPVIFRATEQWFISFEKLLDLVLEEIKKVKWIPPWGEERILSMVKNRPDWCISRQRSWGVPIPAFYCKECKEVILNEDTIKRIIPLFEKEGSDAWFKYSSREILGDYFCPQCKSADFEKEADILDVWFDSGSSFFCILDGKEGLSFPADMYLEGTDQYRGWYQSSLWISLFVNKCAPYREVLTHGFVVDEEGRKMSKSLGNAIDPQNIISKYGADILRLWVAYSDFRSDVKISENILLQVIDAYRKIRNTFRFLLGNIHNFNPEKDKIAYSDLQDIDKYLLGKLQEITEKVTTAYNNFELHIVFHTIYNFCTVDLSSFYFDIKKDCLYTFSPNSKKRESVRTTLREILFTLVKLISPILTFTSEEVWQNISEEKEKSVQLSNLSPLPDEYKNEEIKERFEKLRQIREEINCALEGKRKEGIIGSSLEAKVEIFAEGENLDLLRGPTQEELREFFIVSEVEIISALDYNEDLWDVFESEKYIDLKIKVSKCSGRKCVRCWNFSSTTGQDNDYPDICERCIKAIKNEQ